MTASSTSSVTSTVFVTCCGSPNLDLAKGGVNDCLIQKYGLNPKKAELFKAGFGKKFSLKNSTRIQTFEEKLPSRRQGDRKKQEIKTLAFCAGSGKSLVQDCFELGVDLFITGELGYHEALYLEMNQIVALELGHKESEVLILPEIKRRLEKKFKGLEIDIL